MEDKKVVITDSKVMMFALLVIVSIGFVIVAIQLNRQNDLMSDLIDEQNDTQRMVAYKLAMSEYVQQARLAGYDDKTIYFFLKRFDGADHGAIYKTPLQCVNHIGQNNHQPECYLPLPVAHPLSVVSQ